MSGRHDPRTQLSSSSCYARTSATTLQILAFLDETVENKISHSIVRDVGGQDKTHLRHVTATKEQTVQSTLPTAATKTRLRMRRKTVEVPQMHDIDKMVRRCCAETVEGLKRPKEMNPWQWRLRKRIQCSTSTESKTYLWTKSPAQQHLLLKTLDHVAQRVPVTWK